MTEKQRIYLDGSLIFASVVPIYFGLIDGYTFLVVVGIVWLVASWSKVGLHLRRLSRDARNR